MTTNDRRDGDAWSAPMPLWKAAALVGWIIFKLTMISALLNRNAAEFIYAGF